MGHLNLNSDSVTDYEILRVQESEGFTCLNISIFTNSAQVKYRICSDVNHPDLDRIQNDFVNGLKRAKESSDDIYLNDYEERSYLFVTFPGGEFKKYTAQKM